MFKNRFQHTYTLDEPLEYEELRVLGTCQNHPFYWILRKTSAFLEQVKR